MRSEAGKRAFGRLRGLSYLSDLFGGDALAILRIEPGSRTVRTRLRIADPDFFGE